MKILNINYLTILLSIAIGIQIVHGDLLTFVSTTISKFTDVFLSAIEEECEYKCPNGLKPKPKPYYSPTSNGCGVPDFKIPSQIPLKKIHDCCDEHDICYGTCKQEKEDCDHKFKKCLYKICKKFEKIVNDDLMKGCKVVAKTFYTGVTAMGCKYYLEAQKEACTCDRYHTEL